MTIPPNLALAFATVERPHVAQRLVRSVREHLRSMPIYVADQSRELGPMASFYAAHDVRLLRIPYDAGVAVSRNRLVREIAEDYFVLCDDDFIIGPQTVFDGALRILAAHPEIGVVGGRLYDFDGQSEWLRRWEHYLEYDPLHRLLISVPIDSLAPRAREVAGVRFYLCDAVLNFSVMRREIFANGAGWDERFKSNGEHEDFFLNLKLNTPYRVAYLPTMRAFHHHPLEYRQYRQRLRGRNEGWRRFLEKWALDQHLEFGLGVRSIDDVDVLVDIESARARFFANPDLSVRRTQSSPGAVLVDIEGRIASVGALDALGGPADSQSDPFGRLLLNRETGELVAPSAQRAMKSAGAKEEEESLRRRYALEAPSHGQVVGYADGEFYFRYDAVLRPERDLLLWYWRNGARAADAKSPERLAVVVRWTADDGAVLVWRSQRSLLDYQHAPYWRPMLVELPVTPACARWLRFDVVTDAGVQAMPVATGFLFAQPPRSLKAAPTDPEVASVEAFALTRLIRDGATPGVPGQSMASFGRSRPARPFRVEVRTELGAMRALSLADFAGFEALFFEDWDCLGSSLVGVRAPPGEIDGPPVFALPQPGSPNSTGRILGFGRQVGLVSLQAEFTS